MYNLFKDSLLFPKNILKYRNKSGWYVTLYLMILTVFVSLGQIIFLVSLRNESTLMNVTDYCEYDNATLQCEGESYLPNKPYSLYGYQVFFMDNDDNPSSLVLEGQSLVFYQDSIRFYWDSDVISTIDLQPLMVSSSLEETLTMIDNALFGMSVVIFFVTNLLLLLFVTLISTLPFIRLKQFIPYKKIFKLVAFAITPFAVLMTFYHLLRFDDIFFYLLMIVAYRSVFVLQRELQLQTFQYFMHTDMGSSNPSNPPQTDDYDDDEPTNTEEDDDSE